MTIKICRVCFEEGDDLESLGSGSDSYGQKLASCVPEIDVYIVCNPSICSTCLPMVEVAYTLRETCIENERKFRTKKSVKAKRIAQATAGKKDTNEVSGRIWNGEAVITGPYTESDSNQFHVSVVFNNCFNESLANLVTCAEEIPLGSPKSDLAQGGDEIKKMEEAEKSEDELINSVNEMCAGLKNLEETSPVEIMGASTASLFSDKESEDGFELDLNSLNLFGEGDEAKGAGRRGRLVSCKICKEMHDDTYMKAHMKTHDVRSTYDCGRCSETFSDTCELETHNLSHLKNLCDVCGNVFGSKSDLAEHKRLHVTVCCGEEFSTGSLLQLHTYQKHGKTCGICKRTWDSFNAIFLHLLEHMGEGNVRCQTCKKTFSSEALKLDHKCEDQAPGNDVVDDNDNKTRINKSQWKRKFQCKLCLRWFQTSRNLLIHSKNHDRKGYFKCEQCTASFALQLDLEQHHLEMHAVPKIKLEEDLPDEQITDWVTCQVCPRKFQTPSLLTQHLLEDHCVKAACIKLVDCKKNSSGSILENSSEASVTLNCYACQELFMNVNLYLKHMKLFHSKCTVCNLRLNDVRNVIEHVRRHYKEKKEERKDRLHLSVKREKPYCELCRKEFASKGFYNAHVNRFHSVQIPYSTKVYRCKVCYDVFNTKQELKVHGKEHFVCKHCKKLFVLKSSLEQHIKFHHKKSSKKRPHRRITSKKTSRKCMTSKKESRKRITSKATTRNSIKLNATLSSSENHIISNAASPQNSIISDATLSQKSITSDATSSQNSITSDTATSQNSITSDTATSQNSITSDTAMSQNSITSDAATSQNAVTSKAASQKDAVRLRRKCKTCGEAFRNTKRLMKHIYAVHSRCTIECDMGKESDDESVNDTATLNAIRCDVCGVHFDSVDELKAHVSVHI